MPISRQPIESLPLLSGEQEEIEILFRFFTRQHLKDELRPSLMNVVKEYAKRHQMNPRRLCAEVHDQMNMSLQGISAKEFRRLNDLSATCYIRDYFSLDLLRYYSSLNELVEELVEEQDLHPVDAIKRVCERILPRRFQPRPQPLMSEINSAAAKAMRKMSYRQRCKPKQLRISGL